jgi:hypothetical protein
VEGKTLGDRLSADQIAWHARARAAGAVVLVVSSAQELDALLKEEGIT